MITSTPYISVSKLAEYAQANPTRRRQIVKSFKMDKAFITHQYHEVKRVIPRYFKSGYKESILNRAIAKIESLPSGTEWTSRDRRNSILALESLRTTELPDLTEYQFVSDFKKLESINLAGVEVSIRPELYLKNNHSGKIGAIKIHISKTTSNQLTPLALKYGSTLIKFGLMESGFSEKEIDSNACIMLDVFQENYGLATAAYKRSVETLTISCAEYLLWWNAI